MPLIDVGVTFNFYPRSAVFSATYKTRSWTNADCTEALDMVDTPVLQYTAGPVGSGGGTLTVIAYGNTYTYTIDSIYDDSTYDTITIPVPSGPSQNLYAWAGDGSGENYARSAADDIIVTPDKPEFLYGWTNYHRTGTQLYKWISNSTAYYTQSATPVVGMHLYDINNEDTGETIAVVNQDGSWDLVSSYTFSFDKDNTVTNYVIDGVTYADDTSVDLADGTHTIVVNGSRTHVYIQGYATCDGPGAIISFIVSGSVITLILPNAGGNATFDAATLTYPIQLTIVNEPI